MRKVWPFAFSFLLFAAMASVAPFMVLYYQELDFTGAQIGLLTGIPPLITFLGAPLWTGLADAKRRHRLIMSLALLAGVLTLAVLSSLYAFVPVLAVVVLLYIFVAPVTPLADSATMFMLADEKEMYGRVRMGGTIGYGLAASIAGALVQSRGLRVAFWGSAALFLLALLISQKLVYGPSKADPPARGHARVLLVNPRWLLFLIVAFDGGLALAALNYYLFPYMKELGASESTMGLALTVGTISEIPILFFANRLIKRLKAYGLLILSMVITGLRLVLFAASGTPGLILICQLLNGLTFPAMWVAGVSYADEHAPAGMGATAQGLFNAAAMGVGTAVGGFIGGPLLASQGGRRLYLASGTVVLAIVALAVLIQRRLPAEEEILASVVGQE
jgi:PPP family 3-phenylpropionic acid transporter